MGGEHLTGSLENKDGGEGAGFKAQTCGLTRGGGMFGFYKYSEIGTERALLVPEGPGVSGFGIISQIMYDKRELG